MTIGVRNGFLAVMMMLALAAPVRAEDVAVGGVRGGDVRDLQFDPLNPATAYAAVRGAGIYKSTDGGGTWEQLFLPNITAYGGNVVLASSVTSGLLLLGDTFSSGASIWRSADSGATWTSPETTPGEECHALAQTPDGTLYAGIMENANQGNLRGRLRISTDGGVTWTQTALDLTGEAVAAIGVLATGRILVGVRAAQPSGGFHPQSVAGSLRYSDDGGATWTTAAAIPGAVSGIALNSARTQAFLTTMDANNGYVYGSTDGATWTAYKTANGCGGCGGFMTVRYHAGSDAFVALIAEQLYRSASGPGYVFGSTNEAATLSTPVALTIARHQTLALSASNASRVLMGDWYGGDGIFLTTNGGGSWGTSNAGLVSQQIDLATKARSAGYRYAASGTGFVYFSDADLASFKTVFRGTAANQNQVSALTFDRQDPKRLFAAIEDQTSNTPRLMYLADAVAAPEDAAPFPHSAWTQLTMPGDGAPEKYVHAILVAGSSMMVGLAPRNNAASGQYLFESTDNGTSWSPLPLTTVGGIRALAQAESDPQVIYAGAGDDAGNTTVGNANGMFKSIDHGVSWVALDSDATLAAQGPTRIVVDPADANRVWVLAKKAAGGPYDSDIWESIDGGTTWSKITISQVGNDGWQSSTVFDLSYASSEGKLILATGGAYAGLMQTPGTGSTLWVPAFRAYGDSRVLYNGSVGLGTGTGLYEITNLGVLVGDDDDDGGSKGCGCSLDPETSVPLFAIGAALFLCVLGSRRHA